MFGSTRNPLENYTRVGVDVAVADADPHRLILMLFDGALAAINMARIQIGENDIAAKGISIGKAIELINNGLKVSLDMEAGGDLAAKLASLYDYMVLRLVTANAKNSIAILDEVANLLSSLRDAWAQIAPTPTAPA